MLPSAAQAAGWQRPQLQAPARDSRIRRLRIFRGALCASTPNVSCTLQYGTRRGLLIGSVPPRAEPSAKCRCVASAPALPAGGPASPAPRCVSGRLAGLRTPRGSGPRPEVSPARSGKFLTDPGVGLARAGRRSGSESHEHVVYVERHPGPSFRVLCDIVAPCLHDFAPARQEVRSHVRALGAAHDVSQHGFRRLAVHAGTLPRRRTGARTCSSAAAD